MSRSFIFRTEDFVSTWWNVLREHGDVRVKCFGLGTHNFFPHGIWSFPNGSSFVSVVARPYTGFFATLDPNGELPDQGQSGICTEGIVPSSHHQQWWQMALPNRELPIWTKVAKILAHIQSLIAYCRTCLTRTFWNKKRIIPNSPFPHPPHPHVHSCLTNTYPVCTKYATPIYLGWKPPKMVKGNWRYFLKVRYIRIDKFDLVVAS